MKKLLILATIFLFGFHSQIQAQNIADVLRITNKIPVFQERFNEITGLNTPIVVGMLYRSFLDSVFKKDYNGMKSLLINKPVKTPAATVKSTEILTDFYERQVVILTGNSPNLSVSNKMWETVLSRYVIDGAVPVIVQQIDSSYTSTILTTTVVFYITNSGDTDWIDYEIKENSPE